MKNFPALLLALLLCPAPAPAGTLAGVVSISVDQKPQAPPRYYLGPYRAGRHQGVGDGPWNVVVFAQGEQDPAPSPPSAPAQMLQQEGRFIPHVLPVLKGTTVEFPNLDDFYHNVFSVVAGERFDLGRYASGQSAAQTFNKPGVVVVRCELHADMKAFILVLETPHFARPDSAGRYALDLPAGPYLLRAWHPVQGEKERPVQMPQQGRLEVNFAF
jgi:plastocyanin